LVKRPRPAPPSVAETMVEPGVPRKALYDKMARLGIDAKRFRK
jgi:two-component system C4-dicarboxylate transport response regulator DctD